MAKQTRRRFLQSSAAVAGMAYVSGGVSAAPVQEQPKERIRLAIVGVANRGAANLRGVQNEQIEVLCDVDENHAAAARKQFPKARFYTDYRRMFDRERKNIDAVVVSTPDHHHAFVAVPAMALGKHVYCEKPLTHSVHEGRVMMETARRNKVITQMGTQIHAGDNYRRVVELIQAGAIGPVRRVHVWNSRRPDPGQRARKPTKPPAGLHYELWLGPAPYRHYHASHTHFDWRWWWDFGGGVLADLGCHYMDLPHWALNLRSPLTVSAQGSKTYKGDNNVPGVMQVEYHYPARGDAPAVHLTWYHGVPGPNLNGKVRYPGYSSGVLFDGEKGQLLAKYGEHRLLPENEFRNFQRPKPTIPSSVGHHREWLDAIRNGGTTTCNFAYSGLLSETVLLGNVAYRLGEQIRWDAKSGRVTNNKNAAQYLQREYRKGWRLTD